MKTLLKRAAAIVALLAFASIGFTPPASAQQFTTQYSPGDVTHILGSAPYFPYGATRNPGNTEFALVPDSDAVPAVVGKFIYYKWSTGTWVQEATASAPAPTGAYGVVITPATGKGANALIQISGFASALCTTTGTAVAAGTTLGFDGAGNLTPIATPATGTVVAIGNGALATSQAATLVAVYIGGY